MFEEKVNARTNARTDRQPAMTLARWPLTSGAKDHMSDSPFKDRTYVCRRYISCYLNSS